MRECLAVFLSLLLATNPAAGQSPAGTWRGYWTRAGDTLPVTLVLHRDTAGTGYHASFSSERLRVRGIPFAQVRVDSCCSISMTLRGDRTTTVFDGRFRDDSSIAGTLREGAETGSFAYSRVSEASQTWLERDITFQNGAVRLSGTLLLPGSGRPTTGVVFLHGSGAESRWASRFLAEQIVAAGGAALIYDKRGVGASSGNWRSATIEDLAVDGRAAVAVLAAMPEMAGVVLGIHGHSQGGTLSPMIAARTPEVRFVIASAASGVRADTAEEFSIGNSVLSRARTLQDTTNARSFVTALVDAAYRARPRAVLDSLVNAHQGKPWYFNPPAPGDSYWTFSPLFFAFDAMAWWAQVHVPVLLLYGGADERVPARESAARIAAALARGGNGDITVRVFPGADHTFRLQPGPSGWPRTAGDYLPSLLSWLTEHHRR